MKTKNDSSRDIITYICNTLFFKKIITLPPVSKIILYGSRARKDNRDRSDIDLAIVCPSASRNDWLQIADIIEENDDTLLTIDFVRYDELSASNPLKQAIDNDGIELYNKETL